MPYVIVEWPEGATVEQKKTVVRGITKLMENMAVPADHKIPPDVVEIYFHDIPKDCYARGGKLYSE